MADHPNAALVREVTGEMERTGDLSRHLEIIDDDVVWHEIGRPDPIRGKQALAERFSNIPEGASIRVEMHDVIANDEHCIALANATATLDGKEFAYRTAEIYHMRDGKITERWAFSDDTQRINEFFGGM